MLYAEVCRDGEASGDGVAIAEAMLCGGETGRGLVFVEFLRSSSFRRQASVNWRSVAGASVVCGDARQSRRAVRGGITVDTVVVFWVLEPWRAGAFVAAWGWTLKSV